VETNETERRRWNDDDWATHWPKREALTDAVTPYLLDALALQPGEHVLDIGCGGGKATIDAASRTGPGGRTVGADISAPLLSLASTRAGDAGVEVRFVPADVQVDQIDGGDFDVAMSQFGVMFFDEPVTAFTNIGRHLRADGRLGFACWRPLDANPWFIGPAVTPFASPPPPPAPGKSPTGPFAFGDPDRVTAILTEARFTRIERAAHHLDVDVPESSVVDDAQLRFMGVAEDAMPDARAAVATLMARFDIGVGQRRFPLAFHIFTAAGPR